MLNKIDKELINKVKVLGEFDSDLDVIIYTNNYKKTYADIKNIINDNEVIFLPIISAISTKINFKNLTKISSNKNVKYICSNTKVCGLIYNSSKIINLDVLKSKVVNNNNHTCVVIDTGIFSHIDFLLGKNRLIKFIDLINQRNIPYDDNGHGTFVSGILCGNSIIDKYDGIDNSCNLIVIKALDNSGETTSVKILEGMQWILNNKDKYNIKVVCMSFGSQISEVLDPLIYGAEVLWDNGITVVSAGGNSGPESNTIMSPGASRKIVTVGSLDKIKNNEFSVADFSSRGPALGFYKPDLVVPGVDIISTNIFNKNKSFYTEMSGTSVSTPIVAGVVSLLYKINPNYTPNQIKYMLINSCEIINGSRNDEGFGRLDLSKLKLL